MVMQIIGGIMKVTGKMKDAIKNELKKLYDNGLLKLTTMKQVIQDIIAKYNPLGDGKCVLKAFWIPAISPI